MQSILFFVLGVAAGAGVAWLILRERAAVAEVRGRSAAAEENARLKALLEKEQENAAAKVRLLDEAQTRLADAFKALSADALKSNNEEFLKLARTSMEGVQNAAKGDLDQRRQAIETLIKPLEATLKTYQERLQQNEEQQARTLGQVSRQIEALTQQSQSLATETQQFRMVLKSSPARGKWGEETLRRVVEAAGMSEHCDFTEQTQSDDKRPDMIVNLPGGRKIIIDAKVPDLDFVAALDAGDAATRARLLGEHARKLKDTIRALAGRDYPSQYPDALDHVVLFMPAESLFSAALEGDRELILWAAGQRIMLATPASLIALLRAVSLSWQQHEQTENVRKIADTAQDLYARVVTLTGHFADIGEGIARAGKAYNAAVGSYERMVRPAGERLVKLGVPTANKILPEGGPVETDLRLPPAG